jgi:nucleoside-diphosphate-sugar epimerase
MSTALVTGAAGFVGRHFTARLRESGWKVWAIDTRWAGHLSDVIDAREFCTRSDFFPLNFDLVIHCAAVVGGRQQIEQAPLSTAVNFEIDAALFRWALRHRPGRVVYFSSSAAYPAALQTRERRHLLAEDDIKLEGTLGAPDEVYGWAKLTGEMLAGRAREQGLGVTVVRPFSGYGEDQDASYPFGAFIDRALRREDPFLVWGTGDQARDFIHIDDIVSATLAMYQAERNGPVNLCSGRPVSMRSLAQQVCRLAGYEPEIETCPAAPSGVEYRAGSASRLFGFYRPVVTLEQGIRRALRERASD